MERLTYFKDGYWRVNFSGVQYQADFVDRLAAYEDIAELCGGFDRLRELAEADRDGRVLILPCKLGTKVYRIRYKIADYPEPEITTTWFTPEYREDIGKTVFLTHEEAKKALQEMEKKA
nr:MAG TPA: hypothetical protein [Caudoviricetes sp.]